MLISVQNNLDNLPTTQSSLTSANLSANGTAVNVKNAYPFSVSSAIQIGKTGESQSEIVVVSEYSADGNLGISGTLRFDHSLDTPVFDIHYDRIIFKRSTTGTAGTAVAIGTTSITPNSEFTDFDDTSGVATYAYKTQFTNSISGDVSSESDWFVPGGPTFYSLQALRTRVKDALYNANYLKSDDTMNDWINEWMEQMTNAAIKVNQGYSMGTTSIGFGTSSLGTITATDFKTANKIEISYDGATYTNSREIPIARFTNADTFSSLYPQHSWVGDTVFMTLPQGVSGTARITYSRLATRLVNDSDELPLSLRSYTTSCIEYVLYKAFDNDLKRDYAGDHYEKFLKLQQDFIHEITPRDFTGSKTIDLSEGLSGGEDSMDLSTEYFY